MSGDQKLPLLQHAGTFQVGTGSTPDAKSCSGPALKKRWSIASPKEKQLQDLEVEEVLHQGMAALFTVKEVSAASSMVARPLKATTMMLDKVVPSTLEEEENDDPFAGAPTAGGCTNGEGMMNFLNNCLGSGMLGMGYCIAQTGLLGGLLLTILSAVLNRRTLLMNMRACQYAGCKPASTEVGSISYGKPGQWVLVSMVVFMAFFCMVSYVDATADAVEGLLASVFGKEVLPSQTTLAFLVWVIMLFPPTLLRSMSAVAMLSFLAFCGGAVIVVSLSAVCVQLLFQNGFPPMDQVRLWPASLAGFMNAFPILMLVFSVQAGGDVVLATLKDTTQQNQQKILNTTFRLVIVMLYTIGALCYLAFLDATEGDILKNLPEGPVANLLRVASLVLVVLSYTIMIIPCKVALLDVVFNKNEAMQESTWTQFYGVTVGLNVSALLFALAVSDLSLVLGFDGAVCTNFVAFMLPTAIFLKVQARPASSELEARPFFHPKNTVDLCIFMLGFVSMIMSSYQLVQRASGA